MLKRKNCQFTMKLFSRKETEESCGCKGNKSVAIFKISIYLFLSFVILEFLLGVTISWKTTNILQGMHTIETFFSNITRQTKRLSVTPNRSGLISQAALSVRLERHSPTTFKSIASAARTNTMKTTASKIPYFEFYHQTCDWIKQNHVTTQDLKYKNCSKLCPSKPPGLVGALAVNMKSHSFQEISKIHSMLKPGGRYNPPDCIPRHHVAIIIAYRNREAHLRILLNNLHPFLQRQQLDYGIYVIEQHGPDMYVSDSSPSSVILTPKNAIGQTRNVIIPKYVPNDIAGWTGYDATEPTFQKFREILITEIFRMHLKKRPTDVDRT